jgi:hypothetical protein
MWRYGFGQKPDRFFLDGARQLSLWGQYLDDFRVMLVGMYQAGDIGR